MVTVFWLAWFWQAWLIPHSRAEVIKVWTQLGYSQEDAELQYDRSTSDG